jgi:hypothetical protein
VPPASAGFQLRRKTRRRLSQSHPALEAAIRCFNADGACGSGSADRVKQQPAIKKRSPYRFEWQFIRECQTVTDDMNIFAHNSNTGLRCSIRGI